MTLPENAGFALLHLERRKMRFLIAILASARAM
jgi:hypothetical protein